MQVDEHQPHKEDEQPALGIVEEDDEFEEFAITGAFLLYVLPPLRAVELTRVLVLHRLGRLEDTPGGFEGHRTRRSEVGRRQAVGGQLGRRRHRGRFQRAAKVRLTVRFWSRAWLTRACA